MSKIENPYPKDVFLWDNNEKLDFNRGRFNQHCFEVWENAVEETAKAIFNEIDLNQFKISKKGCIDLHNRILELRKKYLGEKK